MEIMGIISVTCLFLTVIISFYFNYKSSIINRINRFNENIAENDRLVIKNPELFYLFNNEKVEEMRTDISFYNKMSAFIYLHFNMLENLYVQFLSKKGFFIEKQKRAWKDYIISLFKTKLVVEIWEKNKTLYDYKFTIYIDKLLKAT